jgi:hypothetical protein
MKIDNFVKEYKDTNNNDNFWKKHIKTKYIGIETKQVYAKSIANACNHIKIDEKQVYKQNTFNTYIFFIMKLVELYTDIDFPEDSNFNVAEYYDKLNKVGLIDEFVNVIKKEYNEFQNILKMETDDLYQNEYSVSALLYSIRDTFSMGSEVLGSVLDNVDFSALLKQND